MDDAGEAARSDGDDRESAPQEQQPLKPGLGVTLVLAVVLGGVAGFVVSGAAYLFVNPLLEDGGSRLGDFQGLLWNVVPIGTLAGLLGGAALLRRRRRRRWRR